MTQIDENCEGPMNIIDHLRAIGMPMNDGHNNGLLIKTDRGFCFLAEKDLAEIAAYLASAKPAGEVALPKRSCGLRRMVSAEDVLSLRATLPEPPADKETENG